MGLIKTRPKVRVKVPNEIRPGDRFRASVILDCKRRVEVDFVDVVLTGRERWSVGSGNSAVSQSRVLLRLAARLCDERELDAGSTQLAVDIPLPTECPPSYRGNAALIEYELAVHASVPWWPDRRASFEIHVAPRPRPSPASEPRVFSSDPEGPKATEAHAEMSLSSQWTRVEDIVTGAFALRNTEQNRYTEVHVALVGLETLHRGGRPYTQREYLRYQIRLGTEKAQDGEMVPFKFRLPSDAMADLAALPRPDGVHGLVSLVWSFELRASIRWGSDLKLRVPFAVLPRSPRATDAPSRLAPPTIGSDRLRALWEEVGTPLGLRYEMQQLETRVGDTELSIRRDHLGRDGVHLVIELRYPELHLGLEVEPASKVQQLVGGGKKIGLSGWDREHYVRARDEAQVAQVLGQLVPRMSNAKLRLMDDTHLVVQIRDGGQSRTRLTQFAEAALALGHTLEAVRARIPPPPRLAPALPEWEALARSLGSPLETARMRIDGQLSTLRVEVRTEFDDEGEPTQTWLSVEPSAPLDDEHRFWLGISVEDPKAFITEKFDGEAAAILETLAHGAREVEIEPMRLSVCLAGLVGLEAWGPRIELSKSPSPTRLSAPMVEQKLGRLARLSSLLRGHAGPYR